MGHRGLLALGVEASVGNRSLEDMGEGVILTSLKQQEPFSSHKPLPSHQSPARCNEPSFPVCRMAPQGCGRGDLPEVGEVLCSCRAWGHSCHCRSKLSLLVNVPRHILSGCTTEVWGVFQMHTLSTGGVCCGRVGHGLGWATLLSGATSKSPARHGDVFIPPHHTPPPFLSPVKQPHLSSGLIINNGL